MKLCNLIIAIIVCSTTGLLATPTEKSVCIKIKAVAESTVNGETTQELLSSPSVTTGFDNESIVGVFSTFTNSIPEYEEQTEQTGDSGVRIYVTPYLVEDNVLIKAKAELLGKPTTPNAKQPGGIISVQENIVAYFSLKLDENGTPTQLDPVLMSDGRNLILTISTEVIDNP